ncbi:MAG: hypothetical protein Q7U38_18945 [Methylobacter sp.]|nr:hypothetical protein [Methylobacter sp.]MDP2099818.1 hypothetical protein [Methylobacter sp.]MDP2427787.1 hypothetical protein [Methylobacter sp.]MDP3055000.1 hypothetical protein [Methylobacter sp.]MDP3361818.1 hypothetical protein [Methylobacter sp.]
MQAFARARKIQSPLQLLQLVLLYCGQGLSVRSCTGEVAKLQGCLISKLLQPTKKAVIPAGMSESSAMDGNYP